MQWFCFELKLNHHTRPVYLGKVYTSSVAIAEEAAREGWRYGIEGTCVTITGIAKKGKRS